MPDKALQAVILQQIRMGGGSASFSLPLTPIPSTPGLPTGATLGL